MDQPVFSKEFEPVDSDRIITNWGEVLPSVAHSIRVYEKFVEESRSVLFPRLSTRVLEKVTISLETGCWVWEGARDKDDYGQLKDEITTRTAQAHRYTFGRVVRPLDPFELLDHRCRCHPCVWPVHLDPKTHAANVRAGVSDRRHIVQPHFWQPSRER